MAQYDISVDQHRTWTFSAVVKESGVIQDITGYAFTLTIKKDIKDKKPMLSKQFSVSGPDGNLYIVLSPVETGYLQIGKHVYDIKMVKPSSEVKTLLSGKCTVNRVIGE